MKTSYVLGGLVAAGLVGAVLMNSKKDEPVITVTEGPSSSHNQNLYPAQPISPAVLNIPLTNLTTSVVTTPLVGNPCCII